MAQEWWLRGEVWWQHPLSKWWALTVKAVDIVKKGRWSIRRKGRGSIESIGKRCFLTWKRKQKLKRWRTSCTRTRRCSCLSSLSSSTRWASSWSTTLISLLARGVSLRAASYRRALLYTAAFEPYRSEAGGEYCFGASRRCFPWEYAQTVLKWWAWLWSRWS